MEGSATLKLTTVSILLIIFSDVIGPGVFGCPTACLCYVDEGGLRTANCSGVTFISDNKYNKVFHEIGVLNIQTNNDEPIKLWDDMFISFTKLKFLNLQNCRISYLPKNVFKGLKKVFEINLSSNDIRHFENAVFENIYALNRLNLRGNRLQGSNKPFISSPSLRELDLGYCGMTNIQSEFFHGVKKLARLYLDGNHLQTIKEHILPSKITHLSLANNRIINVPISTINSLSQLRWLDLGANPINCTCALMNLQDILSGHATIIEGDLICAYPHELENISLSKVNENDVCNKETFSTRYHFKKSQTTKYAAYSKKDYYFENEKYNPFEIQGDDPGTSADEYPDENNYDEQKKISDEKLNDETKGEKAVFEETDTKNPENLVESENPKSEMNPETSNDEGLKDKTEGVENSTGKDKLTGEAPSHDDDNVGITNENDTRLENNDNDSLHGEEPSHDYTPKPDNGDNDGVESNKEIHATDHEVLDKNVTEPPFVEDDEIPDGEIHTSVEESDHNISDEFMKNDEIFPVVDLQKSKHKTTSGHSERGVEKSENVINENENSKIEPEIVIKNVTESDTKHEERSSITDLVEVEGSGAGLEEMTTPNSSIPVIPEDELGEHIVLNATEEPIHKIELYPVEHDIEKTTTDEEESVEQIVDKQPINYEEMGPIIVIACIIVFITILVFVAFYKCLCKSKETNRKPIHDAEANNGTELQDITSSLLSKSHINDEKHNNKYPNEVPSPETVNLIKAEKTDDLNEQNHNHDLNQNDNKNDPIIKNGKPLEGSPPPIEKTKVKLTVLPDSVPLTPIFLQKRPTMVNNG